MSMLQRLKNVSTVLTCVGLILAAGCRSIGPQTISRDRFDYSSGLAQSWKNQMLLNLVKTRYLDLPLFLDVGQIVSGYTLETSTTLGLSLPEQDFLGGDTTAFSGSARFTDRPTITYMPLTGTKFLEGFLTPIDPAKVFALVQSGFPADFVLGLTVDSLNGLHNRPAHQGSRRRSDPEFFQALDLLRRIQDAGAVGIRIERAADGAPASVVFFRNDRLEQDVRAEAEQVRELLGLSPGEASYRLVSSPLRGEAGELAVSTRSLWQVMASLAQGVEVPPDHLERKLAPPLAEEPDASEYSLLRIHAGPEEPEDAFVAVVYEGQWFWIANDDWHSKRTFTSTLFMFTLADTGGDERLPLLTIPTQ